MHQVKNLEPSQESSILISFLEIYIAEVNDGILYFLMYQNLCLMQYQYDAQVQTICLLLVLSLFFNHKI